MKRFCMLLALLGWSQSFAGGADSAPASLPGTTIRAGQVWEGLYSCGTGQDFGARLWIKSTTATATTATLEFYPARADQSWPYGRVTTESLWKGDIISVVKTEWAIQPQQFDIPRLTRVRVSEAGQVLLMDFSADDYQRTGCTSARFKLLGTLK